MYKHVGGTARSGDTGSTGGDRAEGSGVGQTESPATTPAGPLPGRGEWFTLCVYDLGGRGYLPPVGKIKT